MAAQAAIAQPVGSPSIIETVLLRMVSQEPTPSRQAIISAIPA